MAAVLNVRWKMTLPNLSPQGVAEVKTGDFLEPEVNQNSARDDKTFLKNSTDLKSSHVQKNPIERLRLLLKDRFEQVNTLILEELQSEISLIPELAKHLIASGGKRMRPLLTLIAARFTDPMSCKSRENDQSALKADPSLTCKDGDIALAAAVEFIHTATLLHDDVVDESNLRRGAPSANALWGNSASVLVGDFLFSRSFQLMVRTGHLNVLEVLSSAAAKITEGEVMQLIDTGNLEISFERYESIIERKTAALFEAACYSGAMLGTTDTNLLKSFRDFGRYFGMTFQILDDVLDYKADIEDFGKNMGDDLKERKVTLPVIFAYQGANESEKLFWQTLFKLQTEEDENGDSQSSLNGHSSLHNKAPLEADLKQAFILIERCQGFDKSLARAQYYADKAMLALKSLESFAYTPQQNSILEALRDLTQYSLKRAF